MAAVNASDLPHNVRELVELLARQPRLNASTGKKRVELILENGGLVEAIVHDRIPARELEGHPLGVASP